MISVLPSIPEAVAAIGRGTLTPLELVDFCLARIDEWEPRVRAWVRFDGEGARREATRLTELARHGQMVGPLHGIPIGIKDILDVAGWPTECGSPLRRGAVASADAEVVGRLRRAGAIVLGKTVTTQFASFDPPPTANPWDATRTPGGSSSGSAAAVATQMCLAAVGSQTGGSIIRPAAYCGVAGFKPTFGAVSLEGVEPLAWHLDHVGPIARSVADLRAMHEVLSGAALDSNPPASRITTPTEITVLSGYFADRASQDVRSVVDRAVSRLVERGIAVRREERPPVDFAEIYAQHRVVMAVEAAAHHRVSFAESAAQFGPCVAGLIGEGLAASAVDYATALRRQVVVREQMARWLPQGRWLVTPATTTTAPPATTTGDPAFNSPWSFLGWPTVTLPCGVAPDGLPVGLQLIGPANSEPGLFEWAALCEQVLGDATLLGPK